MLKKIIILMLAVATCLVLVACGGEDDHQHSLVKTDAKEPTCTEAGNNAYWSCDCGKVFADEAGTTETTVAAQTIAAAGHSFDDADCDTPKTCSECGATEGEALGHDYKDADCDTPKTCSRCNATEGEALGHDYDETAWGYREADGHAHECTRCDAHSTPEAHTPDIAEPTEDAAQLCSVCGYEMAPKKDHVHVAATEWSKDNEYHWNACVDGCEGVELNKEKHTDTDDNDCTTAVICTCGQVIKEAEDDHAYDNACDGDCNNEGCNETRTPADHKDEDNDGKCDSCDQDVEKDADGSLFTPPHIFNPKN